MLLLIFAAEFTPVDSSLIPTGELRPVDGTPFDFRMPHTIGERIRDASDQQIMYAQGYDHNFVLREHELRDMVITIRDPKYGCCMEGMNALMIPIHVIVYTTEPGVQFYTSNFLTGEQIGKSKRAYRQSDAFCLETQHFPDSPNKPQFPSTLLVPDQTYSSTTIYKFTTDNPVKVEK